MFPDPYYTKTEEEADFLHVLENLKSSVSMTLKKSKPFRRSEKVEHPYEVGQRL